MRKKVIIIFVISIVLLTTAFVVININSGIKNTDEQLENIEEEEEKENEKEASSEDDIDNEELTEDQSSVNSGSSDENVDSQNKSESNQQKDTDSTDAGNEEDISNDSSNNSDSGMVDANGENKPIEKTQTIDEEPWVKAGVSKEDYYSKPVYSWARIDYSISECKTIENCENLCMEDAKELAFTENVSCIQIFTYSGDYLGEMLKRD